MYQLNHSWSFRYWISVTHSLHIAKAGSTDWDPHPRRYRTFRYWNEWSSSLLRWGFCWKPQQAPGTVKLLRSMSLVRSQAKSTLISPGIAPRYKYNLQHSEDRDIARIWTRDCNTWVCNHTSPGTQKLWFPGQTHNYYRIVSGSWIADFVAAFTSSPDASHGEIFQV